MMVMIFDLLFRRMTLSRALPRRKLIRRWWSPASWRGLRWARCLKNAEAGRPAGPALQGAWQGLRCSARLPAAAVEDEAAAPRPDRDQKGKSTWRWWTRSIARSAGSCSGRAATRRPPRQRGPTSALRSRSGRKRSNSTVTGGSRTTRYEGRRGGATQA